jgi:hypothetical protein
MYLSDTILKKELAPWIERQTLAGQNTDMGLVFQKMDELSQAEHKAHDRIWKKASLKTHMRIWGRGLHLKLWHDRTKTVVNPLYREVARASARNSHTFSVGALAINWPKPLHPAALANTDVSSVGVNDKQVDTRFAVGYQSAKLLHALNRSVKQSGAKSSVVNWQGVKVIGTCRGDGAVQPIFFINDVPDLKTDDPTHHRRLILVRPTCCDFTAPRHHSVN